MLRNAASMLAWMARVTTTLVGLAIMLALVVGVASAAFGADGQPFLLGKNNVASALTKLTANRAGPAMQVINNDPSTNATALSLQVASGKAPMKVNSTGKVTNFNADRLDGKNDTDFYASGSKVADSAHADQADTASNAQNAETVDGKDSSAFAIRTAHAAQPAHECDTPGVWNECAPVQVTVPAGESYVVSVWSSFTATSPPNTAQTLSYCSAGKGPSIATDNPCVTPFGVHNSVRIDSSGPSAAASSGDTISLSPGNYTFFTGIKAIREFAESDGNQVITKVLVRDASNEL